MGVIRELEKLRGIAILAVVLIHATAPATVHYPIGTLKYLFYNAINSVVQFSVPLFLFISSVILSYKLKNKPEPVLNFYWKRLKGAVIPYVLWSFSYALLKSWLNGNITEFLWLIKRGTELWTGTAFYHLYFFLIIIQLYLVLPVLVKLLHRLSLMSTLTIAVLLQGVFYFLNKAVIYQWYPHPGNLLGSYIPVVILGCWLGINYRKVTEDNQGPALVSLVANLLIAALFIIVNTRVRSGQQINIWSYYTIYHSFVTLTAWNTLKFMSFKVLEDFLFSLGQHSFAIYLIHPLFLAFWERVWRYNGLFNYDVTLLTGFLFALTGSYCFGWLLSKKPYWGKILLGR